MSRAQWFLTEGRVNRLMAGARAERKLRGRYTTAGYAHGQPSLYIASVPAGSPQENLRDLNRRGYGTGYRSERPWREEPVLSYEQTVQAQPISRTRPPRRPDFSTRFARAVRRERRAATVCVLLIAAILMIVAAWGQKMIEGVRIQNAIAEYQSQTLALEQSIQSLTLQLETAKDGGRIRNKAQNDLGMLRPERSQKETIYIRASDLAVTEQLQQTEEPQMELLDILLGLLNVFHIGE